MSKIKVYVRVRPEHPKEFASRGAFRCIETDPVSGNWITVKKDGEPKRHFARCWGPQSEQEEVFRTVGVNTVNDVFEGYEGCIFVYGQTGTGKTFTLGCQTPGLEGIQPRALKMIYERVNRDSAKFEFVIKHQYVQIYRESVRDLLDIEKDNLQIRVDEQEGAIIEGVTTEECRSYQDALSVIERGDKNRVVANHDLNSGSSRSHACLVTEIHRTDRASGVKTLGRLYLIDLAGSERPDQSGVSEPGKEKEYKEAVAINQSLTRLANCIAAIVNGEKVVPFRDSKLTRLLQHSLTGHGRTSIILTVGPSSIFIQDTIGTLKFGERAQKVETQMTPAGFRDQLIDLQLKTASQEREMAEAQKVAALFGVFAEELRAQVQERVLDVERASLLSEKEIESIQRDNSVLCKELRERHNQDLSTFDQQTEAEVSRLQKENSSTIQMIETKVTEACDHLKHKFARIEAAELEKVSIARSQNAKLVKDIEALDLHEDEDILSKAEKELGLVTSRFDTLNRRLRGCKSSPYEGMSLDDINEKKHQLMELLELMSEKREELLRRTAGWDVNTMMEEFPKPSLKKVEEYIQLAALAPPSPPSSSDEASTMTESESEASSPDETDTDDDGDEDSTSESESDDDAEPVKVSLEMPSAKPTSLRSKFVKENLPRAHFDRSLKQDRHLAELLEQISEYLEYGCSCYVVNTKDAIPSIHKRHLFLGKNRKSVCICECKPGSNLPDRNTGREIMQLSDITDLMLGQFSEGFAKALADAPMVPQGTTMPPTSAKISLNSLPVFFYRSLTLWNHETPVVDLVMDTDTDFEAWIVTLHRYTMKDPRWGGPLDITSAKDISRLNDEEKKLCSDSHVLPTCLLATKNAVLHKDQRLFYTLFDMRSVSQLDLLHAQKVFEFFFKQKYFERVSVYHVRYLELMQELEDEKRARDAAREHRLRIVNMCRKYVPENCAESALHDFLRAIQGKEQETLQQLVDVHGPEPTADELTSLDGSEALTLIDTLLLKGKKTVKSGPAKEEEDLPPPPPPCEDEAVEKSSQREDAPHSPPPPDPP